MQKLNSKPSSPGMFTVAPRFSPTGTVSPVVDVRLKRSADNKTETTATKTNPIPVMVNQGIHITSMERIMNYPVISGFQIKDLRGQKFERLTALHPCCKYPRPQYGIRIQWVCFCTCNPDTLVVKGQESLLSGDTTSCGCKTRELNRTRRVTHRMSRTPTHYSWLGMIQRCTNPQNPAYPRYGGREITVCDRWMNSFEAFFEDMGKRPSVKHSLDRIDNDLGYSPENCRWATDAEQSRNKRTSNFIEFNGESKCLSDWAADLGISASTLHCRLYKMQWSVEEALTTPVVSLRATRNIKTIRGSYEHM